MPGVRSCWLVSTHLPAAESSPPPNPPPHTARNHHTLGQAGKPITQSLADRRLPQGMLGTRIRGGHCLPWAGRMLLGPDPRGRVAQGQLSHAPTGPPGSEGQPRSWGGAGREPGGSRGGDPPGEVGGRNSVASSSPQAPGSLGAYLTKSQKMALLRLSESASLGRCCLHFTRKGLRHRGSRAGGWLPTQARQAGGWLRTRAGQAGWLRTGA